MRAAFRCLVLLGLAFFAAGCQEELLHGLEEAEASRLAVLIEAEGIRVDLQADRSRKDAWMLVVSEVDLPRARAIVVSNRLPRERENDSSSGLLGPSRASEHHHLEQLRARELERSLVELREIRDARVHLTLPVESWPNQAKQPAKATVLLLSASELSAETQQRVRLLLGSVLDADSITLVVESAPDQPRELEFDRVGPWALPSGVAAQVRWAMGGLVSLVILLTVVAALSLLTGRRARPVGQGETG